MLELMHLPTLLRLVDLVCVLGVPARELPYRIVTKLIRRDIPIVFDYADDPVLQYRCLMHAVHPRARAILAVETMLLEKSRLIAFVSESMRAYYLAREPVGPGAQTMLLPNASDPDHFLPSIEPDEPVVGYLGGAAPGRGLNLLLGAAARIQEAGVAARFRVGIQDGLYAGRLREDAVRLRGVELVRGITYQTAPSFLASTQVCVIPHERNSYLDFSLPVKLFDYMAAGRAICATDNPEQSHLLDRTKAGTTCAANPDALCDALQHLLDDRATRRAMGAAGRLAVVNEHNWGQRIRFLADTLASIV